MKQEREMKAANRTTKKRVCPVAEMLLGYSEAFGSAASEAMSLAEDLDDALYGLAKDLTPADLKAADDQALQTVEQILELRADPDAEWPA